MTLDIAHLRSLLAAAVVRGEWRVSPSKPPNVQYINQPGCNMVAKLHDSHGGEPNAALICAAVNALPELLDEVEMLRAANEDNARLHETLCAALNGMRGVYEAACTAADAQVLTSAIDRRSYESLVWRAVDAARKEQP